MGGELSEDLIGRSAKLGLDDLAGQFRSHRRGVGLERLIAAW